MTVRAGTRIFHEGWPALQAYCVFRGDVSIWKASPGSAEEILGVRGPGCLLGLSAILAGSSMDSSAEAEGDVVLCAIPRETVVDLLGCHPDFARDVLADTARALLAAEEKVMRRERSTVTRRLTGTLLDLACNGVTGDRPPVVRVPRVSLARRAGTTPETVSRELRVLERRGLIVLSRTEILLTDAAELRRISRGDAAPQSPREPR